MDVHVSIAAETLFHVGPIPVTNSMLTMFIVMALLLIVGRLIAVRASIIPGRVQGAYEEIVEFMLGLVEGAAGRTLGRRLFPLVAGLFIFILFANFSGLVPGFGTVGYWHEETVNANGDVVATAPHSNEVAQAGTGDTSAPKAEGTHKEKVLVPFFRSPDADINMTLGMALVTFIAVQIYGIRFHGVGGRIKHMADPPFLFPIEVISEFSRIISLSARLFGNVFAGEVLLGMMYSIGAAIKIAVIPFLFPVVFMFLEVLFGAIQALVFALLTLAYIVVAVGDHAGEEEHSHVPDATKELAATPVPTSAGD
jgi:F-type H+-transporting ATPase subunit a